MVHKKDGTNVSDVLYSMVLEVFVFQNLNSCAPAALRPKTERRSWFRSGKFLVLRYPILKDLANTERLVESVSSCTKILGTTSERPLIFQDCHARSKFLFSSNRITYFVTKEGYFYHSLNIHLCHCQLTGFGRSNDVSYSTDSRISVY